jgi:hypothetical protein
MTEARWTELLADADRHDALLAEFTEPGTFTYDRSLTAFSVRCVVHAEVGKDAVAEARSRADAMVAGTEYELRKADAICMDDIKIRRRR